MASEETWKKLKYFRKDSTVDNWGDADAIADSLLLRLDDFRHFIGTPVYVTYGVSTSGHAEKSYHYRANGACAADIVVPYWSTGAIDLIFAAERFGFSGLGYYPHWKWRDQIVGGLHLDTRPLGVDPDSTANYREARWIGILVDKKQIYVPLTYKNLLNCGGNP